MLLKESKMKDLKEGKNSGEGQIADNEVSIDIRQTIQHQVGSPNFSESLTLA